MTSIAAPSSFDLSSVKKLNIDPSSIRKLTDKEKAEFEKIREMQYTTISNLDDLKNHVSQQAYAEVKVNGQTIATVYNNGTSSTSNAYGGKINNIIEELDSKLSGPDGAQERADAIARAFGGTVVKSKTAVSQAEYLSTPAFQPEYKVDYEAMERDRRAVEGRTVTPQTQVHTQSLASTPLSDTSPEDEFLKFASQSWEEKISDMILKSLGLTKEDLQKMSPEEREKIEAKIREKVKEEIAKKTGISPKDDTAQQASLAASISAA